MLSPSLRSIALIITSNTSGNKILMELCRVLSISSADFWSRAHTFVLPQLVATRNLAALESIAREMSTSASHLLLQNANIILHHLFMLENETTIHRATRFFVHTLQSAAANKEKAAINLTALTKSCIVPLLAELVISLGAKEVSSQDRVRCLFRSQLLLVINKYFIPRLALHLSRPARR